MTGIKEESKHINKYSRKFKSQLPQKLLDFLFIGFCIHWFFQGILYMDRTERLFKLCIDVVFTLLFGLILSVWLPLQVSWPISFLLAHTINFIFNAQFWALMKVYGMVHLASEEFENYRDRITERIKAESSLMYAAVYGSYVRNELNQCSDLDIRLVRRLGFYHGLRACFFVLSERTRALLSGFPLDIYVLDSLEPLKRMRSDEKALVLHLSK
jgi:predicted nucleotidyltransferase